jgi:hypothetical protein
MALIITDESLRAFLVAMTGGAAVIALAAFSTTSPKSGLPEPDELDDNLTEMRRY